MICAYYVTFKLAMKATDTIRQSAEADFMARNVTNGRVCARPHWRDLKMEEIPHSCKQSLLAVTSKKAHIHTHAANPLVATETNNFSLVVLVVM